MEFLTDAITEFLKSSSAVIAYVALFGIVFAESGVLIGFFLPGDSLLITLGFLASQELFNLPLLLITMTIAAITGDSVGYAFGRRVGPNLFNKPDSKFFKKSNLQRAHNFYTKYGARTIVLARFVPFARTFAPILAGMSNMRYRTFLTYNIVGGVGWVFSVTLLGYFLGKVIPNLDHYILYIIGAILVLSAIPAVLEYRSHKKHQAKEASEKD
ncbi:MAG TPA: VTT domain-containing protein [Verrucomicrobiae bacterium]|nr:VTT domain-containing protein [Verrucomicrobiae bacterium]